MALKKLLALGFFAFGLFSQAFALPFVSGNLYTFYGPAGNAYDRAGSCDASAAFWKAAFIAGGGSNPSITPIGSASGNHQMYAATGTFANGGSFYNDQYQCTWEGSSATCEANASVVAGGCSCVFGYLERDGQCVPKPTAAQTVSALNAIDQGLMSPINSSTYCYNGYVVSGGDKVSIPNYYNGETWTAVFPPFTSTGATCSGDTATTADCTGRVIGQMNGVDICGTSAPTNANVTNPSSTASASGGATLPNAPAGATTATTQTSCNGGICTTTTNYTNASGQAVGSTSNSESQSDYCAKYPAAALCQSASTASLPADNPTLGQDKIATAKDQADSVLAGIVTDSGKDTSFGLPSWLTGSTACHSLSLMTLPNNMGGGPVQMDLCPLVPYLHSVLSFFWVAWTFFLVIGLVRETVTRGA